MSTDRRLFIGSALATAAGTLLPAGRLWADPGSAAGLPSQIAAVSLSVLFLAFLLTNMAAKGFGGQRRDEGACAGIVVRSAAGGLGDAALEAGGRAPCQLEPLL